jgi:hypothetical protein
MKTLLISFSLLLNSFFAIADTTEPIVSPSALTSFEASFSKAINTTWEDMGTFYKVSFQLNGTNTTAFYQPDGKFMGVATNLSSEKLPVALRKTLQKELAKSWITDLVVLHNEEGTTYYVNIENADTKTVLKSVRNKKWAFFKQDIK